MDLLLDGGDDEGARRIGQGLQLAEVIAHFLAGRSRAGRTDQHRPFSRQPDVNQRVASYLPTRLLSSGIYERTLLSGSHPRKLIHPTGMPRFPGAGSGQQPGSEFTDVRVGSVTLAVRLPFRAPPCRPRLEPFGDLRLEAAAARSVEAAAR